MQCAFDTYLQRKPINAQNSHAQQKLSFCGPNAQPIKNLKQKEREREWWIDTIKTDKKSDKIKSKIIIQA